MLIHLQEGHFILLCEVKKKKKKGLLRRKTSQPPKTILVMQRTLTEGHPMTFNSANTMHEDKGIH